MKARTRVFFCLPSAFLIILGPWHCGTRPAEAPVAAVETHSEALPIWFERGIRGATLVHIDAHDDLAEVPPEKGAALEALAARGDFASLRRADSLGVEGFYNEGNFITAAARLGVVRDVIWVVPGLGADSAQAPRRRQGSSESAIPLMICTLETMPEFADAVLLSLDLDFLPEFAQARGLPELEAARRLFRVLGKKVPRRFQTVMSYSTNDEYTPILLRWLGDAVADMLRSYPALPLSESERRRENLMTIEGLRRAGDYDGLIRWLEGPAASSLTGAAGFIYLADAFYLRDEIEKSFAACREACRLDKRSAGIFFWVGKGLAIEGRADEAARFIAAGRGADAGARDWQAEAYLAFAMRRARRDAEATSIFERLSEAYDSYSAEFVIGAMLIEQGNAAAAGRRFDEAVGRLDSSSILEADLPEVRAAVLSAVRFYESQGRPDKAARVRNDLRFSAWFRED